MKYVGDRPYADPEKAARRIMELAHAVEPVGRDLGIEGER